MREWVSLLVNVRMDRWEIAWKDGCSVSGEIGRANNQESGGRDVWTPSSKVPEVETGETPAEKKSNNTMNMRPRIKVQTILFFFASLFWTHYIFVKVLQGLNPFTPKFKKYILSTFWRGEVWVR